jgi:hypothetical protein
VNPTLANNLAALSVWSVETAEAIAAATPTPVPEPADVHDEARRFSESVFLLPTYAVVVMGFGSGWHVKALLDRWDAGRCRRSLFDDPARGGYFNLPMIVYEPDMGVTRAALEVVDLSERVVRVPLVILSDADPATMSTALAPYREAIALGTYIADHPPDFSRLGSRRIAFVQALANYAESAYMDVYSALILGSVRGRERFRFGPVQVVGGED